MALDHAAQEVDAAVNACQVFALDTHRAALPRADGDDHGVALGFEGFDGEIHAERFVVDKFHAELFDQRDLGV